MKLTLTVYYINGNTLTQDVNYVHTEDEKLCFTSDITPHEIFQDIVKVPLKNVKSFTVEVKNEY